VTDIKTDLKEIGYERVGDVKIGSGFSPVSGFSNPGFTTGSSFPSRIDWSVKLGTHLHTVLKIMHRALSPHFIVYIFMVWCWRTGIYPTPWYRGEHDCLNIRHRTSIHS
jgi:hypothetical protein